MTDAEANNIIESVIKAHWGKWEFAGQELKVWIEELRKFDYKTAKDAINELYKVWTSTRYPKMPIIMGNIRKLAIAKGRVERRDAPLYVILRQDGRPRWEPFVGNANAPQEIIERDAEFKRDEANKIWPDESHIIQYLSKDKEMQVAKFYNKANLGE